MKVYEASKQEFLQHVDQDVFVLHILEQFELKLGRTSESEIRSWDNSMLHMFRVLNDQRDWKKFHNGKDLAISISLEANELLKNFQWKSSEEAIHDSK